MWSLMTDKIRNLGARKMNQKLMLQGIPPLGQESRICDLGWLSHLAHRPPLGKLAHLYAILLNYAKMEKLVL